MIRRAFLVIFILLLVVLIPVHNEDNWSMYIKKLSSVISLIEDNYFRDVDHEELTFASIKGMLITLDPHSYFLEPKNLARMREEYKGKFYGLGIQIQKQEDRLMVISPIEGTPAYKLGIQAGDIISHINGESTKPISSQQAVQKLRGPKGTKVNITIVREGLKKPLELTIIRGEVPLHSVPYAFIVEDDIGYVYIRNFAETTPREFYEKMQILSKRGMKKLILDLRFNPGGPLFQAIEISDAFLPKEKLIVSVKGRRESYEKDYSALRDNQYENLPVVVLINQGSASGSEIVAGAIKDNDRGYIVGVSSWGKGLVQTVFPLDSNTAVALTTGKYLTPSGRSIQRDYTYLEDYYSYREIPEDEREVKYTAAGRKVLGQGGISPDYEVDISLKRLTIDLMIKGAFFAYAKEFAENKTLLSKNYIFTKNDQPVADVPEGKVLFGKDFVVSDEVLDDFKSFLKNRKIEFSQDAFDKTKDQIIREVEREIFSFQWGIEAGRKAYSLTDPAVLKAIEIFPDAVKLVNN
jgi:carboxyl-terminal processing protease